MPPVAPQPPLPLTLDDPDVENGPPPGALARLGRPHGGGIGARDAGLAGFALSTDGRIAVTSHGDVAARAFVTSIAEPSRTS